MFAESLPTWDCFVAGAHSDTQHPDSGRVQWLGQAKKIGNNSSVLNMCVVNIRGFGSKWERPHLISCSAPTSHIGSVSVAARLKLTTGWDLSYLVTATDLSCVLLM